MPSAIDGLRDVDDCIRGQVTRGTCGSLCPEAGGVTAGRGAPSGNYTGFTPVTLSPFSSSIVRLTKRAAAPESEDRQSRENKREEIRRWKIVYIVRLLR